LLCGVGEIRLLHSTGVAASSDLLASSSCILSLSLRLVQVGNTILLIPSFFLPNFLLITIYTALLNSDFHDSATDTHNKMFAFTEPVNTTAPTTSPALTPSRLPSQALLRAPGNAITSTTTSPPVPEPVNFAPTPPEDTTLEPPNSSPIPKDPNKTTTPTVEDPSQAVLHNRRLSPAFFPLDHPLRTKNQYRSNHHRHGHS